MRRGGGEKQGLECSYQIELCPSKLGNPFVFT